MSNTHPTEPCPPDDKSAPNSFVFKFIQPSLKSTSSQEQEAKTRDSHPINSLKNDDLNSDSQSKSEPTSDPITLAGEVLPIEGAPSGLSAGKEDSIHHQPSRGVEIEDPNSNSRPATTTFADETSKAKSISTGQDLEKIDVVGQEQDGKDKDVNDHLGPKDSRIQIETLNSLSKSNNKKNKESDDDSQDAPSDDYSTQSIYLSEDDREIKFHFYFQSLLMVSLWYLLCFLSVGIVYLAGRWAPKLFIQFTCKPIDGSVFSKENEKKRVRVGVKVSLKFG